MNTAAITSSGIEIPIAPRVISFWWSRLLERFLARSHALRGPRLDPLEEGVDHLRLALEAELLPRLDRELELLLGTIGSLTPDCAAEVTAVASPCSRGREHTQSFASRSVGKPLVVARERAEIVSSG